MSDESENNQPPPVQEETPADNAAPAEEKPADDAAPAEEKPADKPAEEEKPADDAAPAEDKPADDTAPAEDKPADDTAPADEKPADDAAPADEKPADDAAPADEKPADDAAPAEDKPADDTAPAEEKPADDAAAAEEKPADEPAEEKPAAKEEETPAKKDAQKKEDKRRPSTSAQSEASTSRRRSSAVAADPFEGLSAAERVRLGYDMAQKRFAQRRPSAGMISTTPRDPYRPLVKSASVTPQMRRRQEVEAARQAHFAQKSGYDPGKMLPPSTFDGKPNKDPKRSSSWTRDRTTRRPFAPSYDYVPSSRQAPTPGPGAYRDPLANYVGM